jgi:hypothetical protein
MWAVQSSKNCDVYIFPVDVKQGDTLLVSAVILQTSSSAQSVSATFFTFFVIFFVVDDFIV